MHEIVFSDEKFLGVSALRDVLSTLDAMKYCSYGSFLSSILFSRSFSGTFDVLVHDEQEAYDVLEKSFKVDMLHGTVLLNEDNGAEKGSTLKIRVVESAAKNQILRSYLIENAEVRTCIVANAKGDVEKFDIPVPRRGPTILSLLLETDDSPQSITSLIEKIVWSLNKVGVAPLLRESRFVPSEAIYAAADVVEDLFVAHANKTATMLHAHSTGECKTISAADLKKLGRPYAALLRA
jgi:hypothetical protein